MSYARRIINERTKYKIFTKLGIFKVNSFIFSIWAISGRINIRRLESISNSPSLNVNTLSPTNGLLNMSSKNVPIKKVDV